MVDRSLFISELQRVENFVDNQLIGYFIFESCLIKAHLDFLQNVLSELLEDVPLATWNDGVLPHFAHQIRQYLIVTFPGRWIDLTPLDFYLWGWMKSQVYKIKVNWQILIHRTLNIETRRNIWRSTETYLKTNKNYKITF